MLVFTEVLFWINAAIALVTCFGVVTLMYSLYYAKIGLQCNLILFHR
jgi:hypothetical protein